jgi:hypothetical protein
MLQNQPGDSGPILPDLQTIGPVIYGQNILPIRQDNTNTEICGLDLFRHIHEIIMNKCIKLCTEMGLYYDNDSMIIAPTDYTKTSISGILELLHIMDKLKEQKLISHDSYIGRRYSEGCIEEQYKTETGRSCKFEGYEHDDFSGYNDDSYYPDDK